MAFSPQANYTNTSAATAGEVVLTLHVEGVAWSVQQFLSAINLSFLDSSHHFFFQVAPQLS
jgi:hypothetical protein